MTNAEQGEGGIPVENPTVVTPDAVLAVGILAQKIMLMSKDLQSGRRKTSPRAWDIVRHFLRYTYKERERAEFRPIMDEIIVEWGLQESGGHYRLGALEIATIVYLLSPKNRTVFGSPDLRRRLYAAVLQEYRVSTEKKSK